MIAAATTARWRRRLLGLGAAVTLLLLLRWCVCDVLLVVERSMWPALEGGRDRVLLNRLAAQPARFEMWAYRCEKDDGTADIRIKRVLALAGEALALRGGDVYTGPDAAHLQRALRTQDQVEWMRVALPGPHVARAQRWRAESGTLQETADGSLRLFAGATGFHALVLGSVGPGADSVMDDCVGPGGLVHPGRHVVPDTRFSVQLFPVGGCLKLLHELFGDVRGVIVRGDKLCLHQELDPAAQSAAGSSSGAVLCTLPASGVLLHIETLDGMFRITAERAAGAQVLYEAARDTLNGRALSRWSVQLDSGDALLRPVDLSRDVHYFFGGGLASVAAYQVGADSCFTAGDNQPISADSRSHGPVPHSHLLGRAERILLPRARARRLN